MESTGFHVEDGDMGFSWVSFSWRIIVRLFKNVIKTNHVSHVYPICVEIAWTNFKYNLMACILQCILLLLPAWNFTIHGSMGFESSTLKNAAKWPWTGSSCICNMGGLFISCWETHPHKITGPQLLGWKICGFRGEITWRKPIYQLGSCQNLVTLGWVDVVAWLIQWVPATSKNEYIFYPIHTHRIHRTIVYLPIHEWLILMVNVGKYTSPMDP